MKNVSFTDAQGRFHPRGKDLRRRSITAEKWVQYHDPYWGMRFSGKRAVGHRPWWMDKMPRGGCDPIGSRCRVCGNHFWVWPTKQDTADQQDEHNAELLRKFIRCSACAQDFKERGGSNRPPWKNLTESERECWFPGSPWMFVSSEDAPLLVVDRQAYYDALGHTWDEYGREVISAEPIRERVDLNDKAIVGCAIEEEWRDLQEEDPNEEVQDELSRL